MSHAGWTKTRQETDLDQIPSSGGFQHSQRVLLFLFFFFNLFIDVFSGLTGSKKIIAPSWEVGLWGSQEQPSCNVFLP